MLIVFSDLELRLGCLRGLSQTSDLQSCRAVVFVCSCLYVVVIIIFAVVVELCTAKPDDLSSRSRSLFSCYTDSVFLGMVTESS